MRYLTNCAGKVKRDHTDVFCNANIKKYAISIQVWYENSWGWERSDSQLP